MLEILQSLLRKAYKWTLVTYKKKHKFNICFWNPLITLIFILIYEYFAVKFVITIFYGKLTTFNICIKSLKKKRINNMFDEKKIGHSLIFICHKLFRSTFSLCSFFYLFFFFNSKFISLSTKSQISSYKQALGLCVLN